jgi:hypothetical protein
MPVIKTRGQAKAKPATRKPAARGTARKSATAPKRRAAAKPSNGRKAKAAPQRINRSSKMPEGVSKAEVNKILNPLASSAKRRNKHYADWKSEVSTVNELIVDALDAEIPVKDIVESADVSRQHVYKIIADIDAGKRSDNGQATGEAGRPAAKPKARRSAGSKRITRSTNGRKAPAKVGTSTGRPRIRARA